MTECVKNQQTKNHFTHDRKHAKKDLIVNNLSRNRFTVTRSDTFQMFHIPINKIPKDLTAEAVIRRCSVKKVHLKIFQNSQEIDFKMNLKIDSSTVIFSCEFCEFFKNTFFIELSRTTTSAIYIDAKYSHSGQ